ncbi:glucose-6-phosphate isomerase family protein [Haloimpatiens sp. FM7330]|uniref:glucose-6-phosphate isomerase family protein n=1 Tax=Haloimpatiens sp. FM7330 TaxID=3298610 RepID=UPI0036390120
MKIIDPKVYHKMPEGILEGDEVKHYKKYLKDVKNLYKYEDEELNDSGTIMYEVHSYGKGDEDKKGNLFWGLTVMNPVYIKDECNMTRGHFHEDLNCAEFYFGLQGEGLLLLMNKDGEMWAEKISKGSLHHIDGELAHRIINTGNEVLKVGACWPTVSGHDYKSIEDKEFPYRVFNNNGEIQLVAR